MRWRAIGGVILAASLMAACGGAPQPTATATRQPPAPTPTATIVAPTPTATPTGDACTAAEVLRQTDELLHAETFDAHYLTIAGQLTLSIWLVAPEIDPTATKATLAANNRKALERGLLTFAKVVREVPCTTSVFEQLNPMIVDSTYEGWYIDFLPARAFAGLDNPSADELVAALDRAGKPVAPGRTVVAHQPTTAPANACDWPSARANIQPLLGDVAANTTAYIIIGARLSENRWVPNPPDDVDVEVQWTVDKAADATDSSILERLGRVSRPLACLDTPVDLLEAFIVDRTGRLVVYAKVPGPIVRSGAVPLPRAAVILNRQEPGR